MRTVGACIVWLIWGITTAAIGVSIVHSPLKFLSLWVATTLIAIFYALQFRAFKRKYLSKH